MMARHGPLRIVRKSWLFLRFSLYLSFGEVKILTFCPQNLIKKKRNEQTNVTNEQFSILLVFCLWPVLVVLLDSADAAHSLLAVFCF